MSGHPPQGNFLVFLLFPSRPKEAEFVVQLSSLTEHYGGYFVFSRFANSFSCQNWGSTDRSDGCLGDPLGCPAPPCPPEPLLLTSWLFSPFALTIIFLNPKASPASFTKQGKWENRVSRSQGKGLYSVRHPTLRWCHPVLGPGGGGEVLGGNCVCESRIREAESRRTSAEVLELLPPPLCIT